MVLDTGFEPVTSSLSRKHSTAELIEQYKQNSTKNFLNIYIYFRFVRCIIVKIKSTLRVKE